MDNFNGWEFWWRFITSFFETFGWYSLLIIGVIILAIFNKYKPDFIPLKKGYMHEKKQNQQVIDKSKADITNKSIGKENNVVEATKLGIPICYYIGTFGGRSYLYRKWGSNPPHLVIVGESGRGKTVYAITVFDSLDEFCGFGYDIGGDISRELRSKKNVIIYDPSSNKFKFNFFDLVDKQCEQGNYDKAFIELEDLVKQMYPVERFAYSDGASKYYIETGYDIFLSCFLAFYPLQMDFIPIHKMISSFGNVDDIFEEIKKARSRIKQKYGLDHPFNEWSLKAFELTQALTGQNEKNTSGALGEAKKISQKYNHYPLITEANLGRGEDSIGISIINSKFLIMKVTGNDKDRYKPITELITSQSLMSVRERSIGALPRQFLLLDEFSTLLNNNKNLVDYIINASETFRKYNSTLIMIIQSLASLRVQTGNSQNHVNAILANVGGIMIFSTSLSDEAKYYCDYVGKKWVRKEGGSSSTSANETTNYNMVLEDIITSEEIRSLSYDEVLFLHQGGFIKGKRLKYYEEPLIYNKDKKEEDIEVIEPEIIPSFDEVFDSGDFFSELKKSDNHSS